MEFTLSLGQMKATATNNSYFDYKLPSDSSSSSPDSLNNALQFGNTAPEGFDPTSQTWDSVDFDLFETFADYSQFTTQAEQQTPFDSPKGGSVPLSKARRRAQNRASQRAFRERKERHVKGLEYQLETLNEKHQDLMASYSKQASSVAQLYRRITELQAQIKAVKTANDQSLPPHASNSKLLPDSFDAFAFGGNPGPMLYSGEDFGLEESGPDTFKSKSAESESLPLFEDLLRIP
ncbi:hypothetical protein LTR99_010336 [Exophiala xenobiotica]|uniref:BZIP domain-containing protein n=1 Tax=Vermiconidia calcicola TaxID=1690605 RepID=A0AAV9Q1Y9_9PEZI|nr:hypothetical protein LTR92_007081 [Exophiala xenobiotica]KAK5534055.1 hypothetical protein LTR25_007035 [Vermiconidia calcicola]KAK5538096.1 hypothetical protein LTR23_007233 [Chaetothyriales sp. CCFEE 6169]KAK5219433.1 hypothetical protein LTR72_007817 [Exophiala xenobiotica]KAK5226550.1 hypothetical protein LTR47_009007 [Exophiala xenobiotica]